MIFIGYIRQTKIFSLTSVFGVGKESSVFFILFTFDNIFQINN
jgi:hypothetical protein